MKINNFKFIDLFSGIGGFHQAMSYFGGECVFSSEIDKYCINTYFNNFNISSDFDITKVNVNEIPKHDLLCAGFPCQAFSKAGKQKGLLDTRGTLFFEIQRILEFHKTKYIILENVRNLVSHDNGNTWNVIHNNLNKLGYRTTSKPLLLSPHNLKIPQLRERVFIIGKYDLDNIDKDLIINNSTYSKKNDNSIYDIIDKNKVEDKYYISKAEDKLLETWNKFYIGINKKILGFPIWFDYLNEDSFSDDVPKWKLSIILKNKLLYKENKKFIDKWKKENSFLKDLIPTYKKFEWQAGDSIKSIWEGIIQFRPSGIRVKKTDVFPALVAMVQIPIIGKYKRRLTVEECSKLQSFIPDYKFSGNDKISYKQLGNSVNVDIVKHVFELLINSK
ncbi:DNA cytosine methyltransferase [Mycoplasma crocodyli]|uniref:Cytosine-specific methyltransferase n=1 Tax=Mycoplasma crocodyli (strain ATCC 51981 / MP145) TaxID=512564 RepID=D5E5D5_MYCCM|nr:DNA cytosine methyltransferase [Mycoplasma crocodyli]ADE19630.1 cytosine-specific DNA modification methyltransferase [Mycoplasma crocodyli MP145]